MKFRQLYKKATLLILLVFPAIVEAQQSSVIDSLETELSKLEQTFTRKEDSLKVLLQTKLGFKYIFKDLPKSKKLIETALYNSKENKFYRTYTEATNAKGVYFAIAEMQDSCGFYFKKTLALSKKYGLRDIETKSLNNLGLYYWNEEDFTTAQKYFFESLELSTALNEDISSELSNIGLIYQELKQYEKAIEYHNKSYYQRLENKDAFGQSISLNNLGICYRLAGKYEEAIETFSKCINISKKTGNLNTLYDAYQNLGNSFFDVGNFKKALLHFQLSFDRDKNFPLQSKEEMVLLGNFARTYIELKDYPKALDYAKRAEVILLKDVGSSFYSEDIYNSLSIASFALNKIDSGIEYNKKYYDLLRKNYDDKNQETLNELEVKYQTEKKEKELLKVRAEKATTELNLSNQRFIIYGLIAGLLVLLLIGFSINQRNKRKHQVAVVQQKEQNLQSIILAEEKERTRIARELHDGIVQQIGATILKSRNTFKKLGISETPESKQLLEDLEASSSELRSISHQMMPRSLEETGLIIALNELFSGSLQSAEINYTFEHKKIEDRLPKNIEITLYRITQELINNILKYSRATEVSIQLFKTNNSLLFMLEDNGIGFDINDKNGIGLTNIKSRIDLIKGSVSFNSESTGTLTTIKIPL